MGSDWVSSNLGVSRRELLKRSAIAGGTVLWVAPVIQSFTAPAFAGSPPPAAGGGQDISFVALLANCAGTVYRMKFDTGQMPGGVFPASGSFGPTECGPGFNVPCSNGDLGRGATKVGTLPMSQANVCPATPRATATFNVSTGSVTVNLGSCTLIDYRVKCGQSCIKPGDAGAPPAGGSAATFVRCPKPAP